MVTFAIKNKFSDKLVYEYFLENHLDSKCGVISIIRKNRDITLEAAEEDFVCKTSAKELNEMRNAINEMRKETGQEPLTEELSTATEDEEWYYYADHVIRRILNEMEKGNIPEKGTVVWY